MYGGLAIYDPVQARIFKDYKRALSVREPNWNGISQSHMSEMGVWSIPETQSWYYYNWVG